LPAASEPAIIQFFLLSKYFDNRKAWLFSDTQAGARASALIYSLVETAKANDVEPYLWLRHGNRSVPYAAATGKDGSARPRRAA
jgi:hypothetical protein